jgi:rhamnosyltransferase subunit B
MAHFIVSALGSAGDVHPFIAISQALIARGHDVRMLAAPHFEERIRRAGVAFVPLGAPGEYEALLQRKELWEPRGGARMVIDELLSRLPEGYEAVDAAIHSADTVLVGSTFSWGMRLVQEVRDLRAATVHLSPVCLMSATVPPVLPGVGDLSWMPTWSVRLLQRIAERWVLDRLLGPRLNAYRATLGLRPVKRIWSRWIHSPDFVIGAWPTWFASPQPDWPPHMHTLGFPVFHEGGAGLDAELEAFIDAGPAPIGITPGSAMAHGQAFFERAIEACRVAGQRVVLITPFREQLPEQLPVWAHHVAYAPFSALMPRLSALVHHGGIGTSAQALKAGIAQVVVPFAHDQFENAARLRRLGVSRTLNVDATVERWVAVVRGLFDDETKSAVAIHAQRMNSDEPAAQTIARSLEELATRQR